MEPLTRCGYTNPTQFCLVSCSGGTKLASMSSLFNQSNARLKPKDLPFSALLPFPAVSGNQIEGVDVKLTRLRCDRPQRRMSFLYLRKPDDVYE